MRVLLIEDDAAIASGILDSLRQAGFDATRAPDGRSGLHVVAHDRPDLVLLDLGLPDLDGTDVCRRIRAESDVPIIVVSARADEFDRVLALELGADDYLVKPFGNRELTARIRAVARRSAAATGQPVETVSDDRTFGPLHIDPRSRRVTLAGAEINLTPKEFELLDYLSRSPGAAVWRTDILRDVWGTRWYGTTKTVDAHVAAIRKKLGNPEWIQAVRGVGFRFEEPP
ncbi:MAG: response regulator transcription factor [Nocardiaceae bacterium]|nr:response regulator transcription factor [Nocardiaceae bacterium]